MNVQQKYVAIGFCFLSAWAVAVPPARAESELTPLTSLDAWAKAPDARTPAEQRQVRLHGIRNTPLNPKVWATLRKERTHNVRIVPIKRFFLRHSEAPEFRTKTMTLRFNFERASKKIIEADPHDHDPVLEFGFRGKESASSDEGYALRVSAAPGVASGIYYHVDGEYYLLAKATPERVGAYARYTLAVDLAPGEMKATLNGLPFASMSGETLDEGLVSLAASWHPVYVKSLDVTGRMETNGQAAEIHDSGLVESTGRNK